MLRTLLYLTLSLFAMNAMAQQVTFERFILGTGGQVTDTLDNGTIVTLDLSSDDAEQENDEVDSPYDDDLDAGWEGDPEDLNVLHLGLRFQNIEIPQGAVIDSAFVVFHAHEGKDAEDVAELLIVGEATDDAVTFDEDNFNEDYLLTDRPQTSAEVEWTVAEEWTIWQPYKTSDVGEIIQEIVNREGWVSGNALALILLGQDQGPSIVDNAREFTAFENIADPEDTDPEGNPGDGANHPERRPYLQVYYQGPVGVTEIDQDIFNIYPNPTTDVLNISLKEAGTANVMVSNIAGQEVFNAQLTSKLSQVDLGEWTPGVYIVRVQQNGYQAVRRLMVK